MACPNSSGLLRNFEDTLLNRSSKIENQFNRIPLKEVLPKGTKIEIDQDFLKQLIFFAPEKYMELFLKNPCSLHIFLKNGLLKTASGYTSSVVVRTNENKRIRIPINLYSELYFKNHCRRANDMSASFGFSRIKKTLGAITPKPPRSEKSCKVQWEGWQKKPNLIHICTLIEKSKKAKSELAFLKANPDNVTLSRRSEINKLNSERKLIQNSFTNTQFAYYSNLCENFNNVESFCLSYSSTDAWNQILNYELPQDPANWKCKSLLKREITNRKQLEGCIAKIKSSNTICINNGENSQSSLFPMPDCTELGRSLANSRLHADYHDCPSDINNTAITNIYRILGHFKKGKFSASKKECVFPAVASVYELYKTTKEEDKWPLEMCFKRREAGSNKIVDKCLPFVPGNHPNLEYSLNNVATRALQISRKSVLKQDCRVANLREFNPQRLKYKTGCWIIPQTEACQNYNCPQNILLDNKVALEIKTRGALSFDYFKNKFSSKDQALINRVMEIYELKEKRVSSLTSARFFFKTHKKGVIHGMGCIEDIYPEYFNSISLNQCTPTPFIVDGLIQKGNKYEFVFRSAIDDLHSPRLISWPRIFSSVARYSEFHPIKQWNLYGLY